MERVRRRSIAVSLLLTAQPRRALAVTLGVTATAATSGRTGAECLLVAITVLVGQATVGWVNDLVDRKVDTEVGRLDKPLARGWLEPGTVRFAAACGVLLVVPLSIDNGTEAGIAHLGAVASGLLFNVWFRRSALSWLPFAVSFGLLPAFLSYGGLGGGLHGEPPTLPITVLAALLGIGVHFAQELPRLVDHNWTGRRTLPLRVALRVGAPRLLWLTTAYLVVVSAAIVGTAITVGLRH